MKYMRARQKIGASVRCSCVGSSNSGDITSKKGEKVTLFLVISFCNVIATKLIIFVFVGFSQKSHQSMSSVVVLFRFINFPTNRLYYSS